MLLVQIFAKRSQNIQLCDYYLSIDKVQGFLSVWRNLSPYIYREQRFFVQQETLTSIMLHRGYCVGGNLLSSIVSIADPRVCLFYVVKYD